MFAPNDHYQPFWIWAVAFGGIGAIVGFFSPLNRIVERFFPSTNRKRYPAAMGNALIELSAVVEPSREHILEVRRYQRVEEDQEGEPPEIGGRH
jgi:hypothetical protein